MLKVENVSYIRNKKVILDNISFEAKTNKVLAILGPNGAGKSTLLNIFSGYLDNYSGNVTLNNNNLKDLNPQKLSQFRSVVPQKSNLNVPFKVFDIVMMGRTPHNKIDQKINYDISIQAIKDVGIEEYIEKEYTYLSGGEQQRVHIARALAQIAYENEFGLDNEEKKSKRENVNKFLFLDEHTSNLDIGRSYQLMNICKKFVNQHFGIIWVVHDINLALDFADEFLLLKNGKVFLTGDKSVLNSNSISQLYDLDMDTKSIDEKRFYFIPQISN